VSSLECFRVEGSSEPQLVLHWFSVAITCYINAKVSRAFVGFKHRDRLLWILGARRNGNCHRRRLAKDSRCIGGPRICRAVAFLGIKFSTRCSNQLRPPLKLGLGTLDELVERWGISPHQHGNIVDKGFKTLHYHQG